MIVHTDYNHRQMLSANRDAEHSTDIREGQGDGTAGKKTGVLISTLSEKYFPIFRRTLDTKWAHRTPLQPYKLLKSQKLPRSQQLRG